MTTEEALKTIEENSTSENGSFLYFTHERSTFDEDAFWKFYNAIRVIAFEFSKVKLLDRDLVMKIIKPYEFFILQIGFHFDRADQYEIKDLPNNYTDYCSRLMDAVDSFITGEPISDKTEASMNEELFNKSTLKVK